MGSTTYVVAHGGRRQRARDGGDRRPPPAPGRARARPDAVPRRAVRDDDPRRHGRGRDQDRATGRRDPAQRDAHQGRRDRSAVVHGAQPEQAQPGDRPPFGRGSRAVLRAGRAERRRRRELQAGHDEETGDRLRDLVGAAPRADLRKHHRLRRQRAVRAPPRARPDHAGDVRDHERHRRARAASPPRLGWRSPT